MTLMSHFKVVCLLGRVLDIGIEASFVRDSSLALCCVLEHPLLEHIICLVLVQPGKTGSSLNMIEKLLTGTKRVNTNSFLASPDF